MSAAAGTMGVMTTWQEFATEAPDLAAAVRARLTAHRHHVLATLRRDGSPRVSGTEVAFYGPDLVLGSMPGAVKAMDLRRDGRLGLHANPGDGSMAGGDAKIGGVAHEVTEPAEHDAWVEAVGAPTSESHLFRIDLTEAVLTSVAPEGDRLVIETWRPGRQVARAERA
jgi:hypothetical protein